MASPDPHKVQFKDGNQPDLFVMETNHGDCPPKSFKCLMRIALKVLRVPKDTIAFHDSLIFIDASSRLLW